MFDWFTGDGFRCSSALCLFFNSLNMFAINSLSFSDLLEQPELSENTVPVIKAKQMYQSCMNLSTIETLKYGPLRQLISDLGGWPVIGDQWSDLNFSVEDAMAKIRAAFESSIIIEASVDQDDKNSKDNIIRVH